MYVGIYVFFILVFCNDLSLSQLDYGFFDTSSKVKNNFKPSSNFFSAEFEAIKRSDSSLDVKDDHEEEVLENNEKIPDVCSDFRSDAEVISASKNIAKCTHISKNVVPTKRELLNKAYFTRFINIFLRSTGLEEYNSEDEGKILTVDVKLSKQDLTVLKNFGSGDDVSFEALENSFTSMFSPVKDDDNSKPFYDISTLLFYCKYSVLIGSAVAIVLYIFYLCLKHNLYKALIMLILYVTYVSIVAVDLVKQYDDISELIILRRMEFDHSSNAPKECFLSKMQLSEKLYYHMFGGNDICERFLVSRKSVWYQIDIFSAVSKPIFTLIMNLMSLLGEGSEKMIKPFTDNCPWPINIVIYSIFSFLQLPLIIVSLCLIFSVFCYRRISFKVPLLSISSERQDEKPVQKEKVEGEVPKFSQPAMKIDNRGGIILLASNEERQLISQHSQGEMQFYLNQASGESSSGESSLAVLSSLSKENKPYHLQKWNDAKSSNKGNIFDKHSKTFKQIKPPPIKYKSFKKQFKWKNVSSECVQDLLQPVVK